MTAQIHEALILDGEETSMACCPQIPESHPRIIAMDFDKVDDDPENFILFSTACRRGYQGTWEIKEGRFYLAALRGCLHLTPGEPLFADWFTGTLRIPQGKVLKHGLMGQGTVYEEDILIEINQGQVIASQTIDNRDKKRHHQE